MYLTKIAQALSELMEKGMAPSDQDSAVIQPHDLI